MPLSKVLLSGFVVLRQHGRSDFDSLEGPAHDAAEDPMYDANQQYDLVLGAGEIPEQNIDQRDGAKYYAQR